MGQIKVKQELKSGQSVSGRVINIHKTSVVLEHEDETLTKIAMPPDVLELLEEDFGDAIVLIKKEGDDYDVKSFDDYDEIPEEKDAKKEKGK